MAGRGVKSLRYWNDEVMSRTEEVLADVWSVVDVLAKPESNGVANGDIFPSSALRAPSPGGRREGPEPERFYHAPGHAAIWDIDVAEHTLPSLAEAGATPDLAPLQPRTRRTQG